MRTRTAIIAALAGLTCFALARPSGAQATHPFTPIAQVLQSPRCMNCHPSGDAPLQTDLSLPHKQNVKRSFTTLGGACSTCHQEANLSGPHMPPGAPHWGLPPAEMVFQGKTTSQLCVDLKNPALNGNRSLDDLKHHVSQDPLVLWGWAPGDGRTTPPLTHPDFVAAVETWISLGAPCP